MPRDLVSDVNKNGRETFLKYANHVAGAETQQFGPITAVSIGLPAPVYNQLFAFETPAREHLTAGVEWMANRDVPFWLTMPETIAESDAVTPGDFGLVESDEMNPGMAMASITDIPTSDTVASISEVTDADGREAFIRVFGEVFGMPADFAEQATPASMLEDPDIRLFVARRNGRAVACGQLVVTDDVAGIYSIGVVEEYRRQGLGEAITWEALRAGREAGCEVGTLQSTEMAYSLYQRIGFETVTTYHHYEPDS